MLDLYANWTCPYCGHKNRELIGVKTAFTSAIAHCDTDMGGCDGRVVLDLHPVLEVTTHAIETERAAYEKQEATEKARLAEILN